MIRYLLFFLIGAVGCFAKVYPLLNEPIDVVIPCIAKDRETLGLCIAGIKKNAASIRRIIVLSPGKLTGEAEWFDEALFPFTKQDVAFYLMKGEDRSANFLLKKRPGQVGWCYQQLLKLYAPFVIPDLSSNVLILDADTIFLNPVDFLDASGGGLYAPGFSDYHVYYEHADRCLHGIHRVFPEYSGIAHHMLFQKPVLQDLFFQVEQQHRKPFWKVFCFEADASLIAEGPYLSEYELYFNFAFANTDQVHIRQLQWADVASIDNLEEMKEQGYHYVSNHSWMRKRK
jgi:hypothetical protein